VITKRIILFQPLGKICGIAALKPWRDRIFEAKDGTGSAERDWVTRYFQNRRARGMALVIFPERKVPRAVGRRGKGMMSMREQQSRWVPDRGFAASGMTN